MERSKTKRKRLWELLIIVSVVCFFWWLKIRRERERANVMIFGTSAVTPPMTFCRGDEVVGFEVDLAKILAGKLGKKPIIVTLDTLSFDGALVSGRIDAYFDSRAYRTPFELQLQGIDPEYNSARLKTAQVSIAYHEEGMVFLYRKDHPVTNEKQLRSVSRIASSSYSPAMEAVIKRLAPQAQIAFMEGNAVEALKAELVECAHVDFYLAEMHCYGNAALGTKGDSNLGYWDYDQAKSSGVRMTFSKKRCPGIRDKFNQILKDLDASGELQKLRKKWGLRPKWELKDDELSTRK